MISLVMVHQAAMCIEVQWFKGMETFCLLKYHPQYKF